MQSQRSLKIRAARDDRRVHGPSNPSQSTMGNTNTWLGSVEAVSVGRVLLLIDVTGFGFADREAGPQLARGVPDLSEPQWQRNKQSSPLA